MAQTYLDMGVSATKDEVKEAVKDQDKGVFPGAFCKIMEDIAGDDDYCFAVHADGAGTKSSAAYLMYRETGDSLWFRGIAQDSLTMNTDDLAAVGALDGFVVSNTIGRNAHRVDGDCIAQVIKGYDQSIDLLKEFDVDIRMAGGETADVGDLVKTLIADSTIAVRLKRNEVIDASNIRPGDVIVGLASFGRATYEEKENSGIGSNGLTAARHALLNKTYLEKYPESVSETITSDKLYGGAHLLSDKLEASTLTVGEAILSPTRTYIPLLRKLFESISKEDIHGIIHCTGGGQVKCRDFGQDLVYIKDKLFDRPPIFKAIYESDLIPDKEMYQIFNMGHRMELYCDPSHADLIIETAKFFNIEGRVVGWVTSPDDPNLSDKIDFDMEAGTNIVIIRDRGNEYIYY